MPSQDDHISVIKSLVELALTTGDLLRLREACSRISCSLLIGDVEAGRLGVNIQARWLGVPCEIHVTFIDGPYLHVIFERGGKPSKEFIRGLKAALANACDHHTDDGYYEATDVFFSLKETDTSLRVSVFYFEDKGAVTPDPKKCIDQVDLSIELVKACARGAAAHEAFGHLVTGLFQHDLIVSAERDSQCLEVNAGLGAAPCVACLTTEPRPLITVSLDLQDGPAERAHDILFDALREIHSHVENGVWIDANVATRLTLQPECVELTILPLAQAT